MHPRKILADTGSGLLQRADSNDGGSINEVEIHLTKCPKLFRQTEPLFTEEDIMGQFLRGSGKAKHAIRAERQRSKAPVTELAWHYGRRRIHFYEPLPLLWLTNTPGTECGLCFKF